MKAQKLILGGAMLLGVGALIVWLMKNAKAGKQTDAEKKADAKADKQTDAGLDDDDDDPPSGNSDPNPPSSTPVPPPSADAVEFDAKLDEVTETEAGKAAFDQLLANKPKLFEAWNNAESADDLSPKARTVIRKFVKRQGRRNARAEKQNDD